MTTILEPMFGNSTQCISCFWYVGRISDGVACYAFPTGIPPDIIEGRFDHREPYPDDAGIHWREDPGWAKPFDTEESE